jgi:hypothetical protein
MLHAASRHARRVYDRCCAWSQARPRLRIIASLDVKGGADELILANRNWSARLPLVCGGTT